MTALNFDCKTILFLDKICRLLDAQGNDGTKKKRSAKEKITWDDFLTYDEANFDVKFIYC